MKASLIVLGLACFVGALHALPLQEENEDKIGTFIGVKPQIYPDYEEEERRMEPNRPGPPQVHDNAFRSQGPMSGRLTNVVVNRKGAQKTLQVNRIEYNLNSVRDVLRDLLENEEEDSE